MSAIKIRRFNASETLLYIKCRKYKVVKLYAKYLKNYESNNHA